MKHPGTFRGIKKWIRSRPIGYKFRSRQVATTLKTSSCTVGQLLKQLQPDYVKGIGKISTHDLFASSWLLWEVVNNEVPV